MDKHKYLQCPLIFATIDKLKGVCRSSPKFPCQMLSPDDVVPVQHEQILDPPPRYPQKDLGPEATVRPFTRDGEDGFLIQTPGPCLSDEQIDDICIKSIEMWERQAASRASTGSEGKKLKRPLHQPVLISKGSSSRRRHEDSRRDSNRDYDVRR
ncbi:hypothetical protein FJTKL_03183 [Diaporthe vaccinii]|uniref:Uncharacterized protein n=1 Tax=Diaporthe vaccinii TaxID=105482 RepID=A0ABR4DWI2_9PEZI